MSIYVQGYNRVLKSYDRDLFVDHNPDGTLCVFRHAKYFEPVIDTPEYKLSALRTRREYVFALTSNWGLSGKPRDWGVDDVSDHIRKIDSLANARFLEEADDKNKKVDDSKRRDMKNQMESFAIDFRKPFQRATNDILISGLDKTETKRRLKDRRIKNG